MRGWLSQNVNCVAELQRIGFLRWNAKLQAVTCRATCFLVARSETRGTFSFHVSAVISHVEYVLYFYISTFRSICLQCPIRLFFCSCLEFRAFLVCCSGIVWVILKWFQSPLLLPVSLLLSHSSWAEFLLWGLYILKSSRLLSWAHFFFLNQQSQHNVFSIGWCAGCLGV